MEQQFTYEVLEKLKRKKHKKIWKRILSVLMCVVVFCTTYMLILPAITKENKTFCGITEHTHGEGCYEKVLLCETHTHTPSCYETSQELSCTIPTDSNPDPNMQETLPAHIHTKDCYKETQRQTCAIDTTPGHEHTDACYEERLSCQTPVHIHGKACFADKTADVETAAQWEATLPTLSGKPAQDILAIARSQLGYRESTKNYIIDSDNKQKGYTRYGQWYGVPYGDWCATFASFCLHYAGAKDIPTDASCTKWISKLKDLEMFELPADHIPRTGDLIFFDWDNDGKPNHVGLVENMAGTDVITIEGNSDNQVSQKKYDIHNDHIIGYGALGDYLRTLTGEASPPDPEKAVALAELSAPVDAPVEISQEEPASSGESVPNRVTRGSQKIVTTTDPLDLKPYINNVTMFDSNGNVIPSGSLVTEGDKIEFKIDFTLESQILGIKNPNETITVYTDTLIYDLPGILKVSSGETGDIINAAGVTVGEFTIDAENGRVILKFHEQYVNQNISGMQIHGHISVFSNVVKITDEESENQTFPFKDGLALGIIIEEKVEAVGDLTIEKKKISVNGEELIYEVTVTSKEGTTGGITITDTMSEGLIFVEGLSVQQSNGATVHDASFIPGKGGHSFTLNLPEMAPGATYTVRYRCQADVDLLGADMTVRNTASVTGKDSQDNELKDKVTVDHQFELLKKTGKANDDGTITWTVTVNQAKADISGWTLVDVIITATGESSYTGTVTITDSAGNILSANARLPYTFPRNSKDTYTITYTTSHKHADGQYISNRAVLKDDNTDVTVLTGTSIGEPLKKEGHAGEVTQIDGKYLLPITWTVTIDTSIGEIPAGNVLKDSMEDWNNNEMYMTYSQLMDVYESIRAALEAEGSSVSEFAAQEHRIGMGRNDKIYTYSELTGNVGGTHDKLYESFEVTLGKAIPKGKLITFTYETYGEFENNVLSGAVYTNQLNISNRYNIKSTVQYSAGEIKAKKMALLYYDPVADKDKDWLWNKYHYNGTDGVTELNYENLHDDYLAWTIELSVPLEYLGKGNVIILEDLPEGVTLAGLTLPFNSNVPTKALELWDIQPGNTYEWTFPLYAAQQYINWDFRNPQDVTITINVTQAGDLEIIIPGVIFETMAQYAVLTNEQYQEWYTPEQYEDLKLDEWYGYLHIFTQINDDVEWMPESEGSQICLNHFENKFTITDESGRVVDIGSQTQSIRKDESSGIIRKTASTESGNNIITYAVVLNAYGRDMVEGTDILNIHDELVYTSTVEKPLRVRLVPGSVALYEIDLASDGSYKKLRELPANYSYNEVSSGQSDPVTWTNTIDLTVPDNTVLLLEYKYNPSGSLNVLHNIQNTCAIEGFGENILDGDHKIEIEVKQTFAQADTAGVLLYKVDANSDGIFLQNARFNIFIWNNDVWNEKTQTNGDYIIVHHADGSGTEFVTDPSGMIIIDGTTIAQNQFAYNTAYYIVEIESPEGYYLGPEPYYFQIGHSDLIRYPSCLPPGFQGHYLTNGDIIYRENTSDTTEIHVQKSWKNFGGGDMTVTADIVPRITLELWRKQQGVPGSDELYDTYTMTPDADGNWNLTITGLPKATKNADGTKGTDYLYYIKELVASGYALESAENNAGINAGIIKLVNRRTEGYVIPETGGIGTHIYTTVGVLLIVISTACLVYNRRKRRRGGYDSS